MALAEQYGLDADDTAALCLLLKDTDLHPEKTARMIAIKRGWPSEDDRMGAQRVLAKMKELHREAEAVLPVHYQLDPNPARQDTADHVLNAFRQIVVVLRPDCRDDATDLSQDLLLDVLNDVVSTESDGLLRLIYVCANILETCCHRLDSGLRRLKLATNIAKELQAKRESANRLQFAGRNVVGRDGVGGDGNVVTGYGFAGNLSFQWVGITLVGVATLTAFSFIKTKLDAHRSFLSTVALKLGVPTPWSK